jgi:hypothetical protein
MRDVSMRKPEMRRINGRLPIFQSLPIIISGDVQPPDPVQIWTIIFLHKKKTHKTGIFTSLLLPSPLGL